MKHTVSIINTGHLNSSVMLYLWIH